MVYGLPGISEVFVTEIAGNTAVYRGEYKLVRNLPPFGDKQLHLYNFRVDPTESNDLSSTNPGIPRWPLSNRLNNAPD
jgi:hypothetical protein